MPPTILLAVSARLAVPNVEPLCVPINEPVNDPVLICKELLTIPLGNIVGAKDAEVANDAVSGVNVIDVAADDVSANDAVPNNDPVNCEDITEAVNDPNTILDPDINTDPVN